MYKKWISRLLVTIITCILKHDKKHLSVVVDCCLADLDQNSVYITEEALNHDSLSNVNRYLKKTITAISQIFLYKPVSTKK